MPSCGGSPLLPTAASTSSGSFSSRWERLSDSTGLWPPWPSPGRGCCSPAPTSRTS
ncbi:hypothetical protein ACFFX0_22260 [Citricoccus parietis]|uniref:Uncharacterized protein n=1 Tax=Citricoccus parietis TaxID=592307 RepID=A0ABV5G4C6_9MICC